MALPWWLEPSSKILALIGVGAGGVFVATQIFVTQGYFDGHDSRIAHLEGQNRKVLKVLDEISGRLRTSCNVNAGYSAEIALISSILHTRIAESLERSKFDEQDTKYLRRFLEDLKIHRSQIEEFGISCDGDGSGAESSYTVQVVQ